MNIQLLKYALPAVCAGSVMTAAILAPMPVRAAAHLYPAQDASTQPGLHWTGDVDDTIVVIVHNDHVRMRTLHGKGPENVVADMQGTLPPAPVQVYLRHWFGRGDVTIVRQPDADNNYTAAIRIRDPQPGRGHYTFDLGWNDIGAPGT